MSNTVIKVENLYKQYRLGEVGTGSMRDDFIRWRYRMMGKEDPFLTIGDENDRTIKSTSEYVWALKDINFEVKQGEILGIIGRNGAGKSTLLKILSRTTGPTKGNVRMKGRIASLLEVGTGFHGELSGRENIFLNGAIMGMHKAEIKSKLDEIIDFAGVEKYIDTPVKRYSSGMYVRLAFGVAAHLEPDIMIVDEVLAVGDAEFQKKALGKMKEVSSEGGRTILFVSHNMASVRNLCDEGLLLKNGNISYLGKIERTISSYLISDRTQLEKGIEYNSNRSGNGVVTFADFHFENSFGEKIDRIITGEDLVLVFKLKSGQPKINKIDIGFSFQDKYDDPLGNLYSSFQNKYFEIEQGYTIAKCTLEKFSFAPGKLIVRGRILVGRDESDWLKDVLGVIEVEMGDFYGTGNVGQLDWNSKILFKGVWEQ
ncbi:MAG TPA: ABC transporter ATP-binding protein [Sphingobacteriaceae bacterium]|nr:ABC transporter ATP-binding protein [Sphingobacteriaceae bacterium]